MGVEAGRHQDQVGGEGVHLRHQRFKGFPPGLSRSHGRNRRIEGRAPPARLPGARIEGPLVDRGQEQVRRAHHHRLGAIAVVDVEIHHRHALEPRGLGRAGGNGHRGIDAEPHRPVRLGVMARRPDRAEGPVELPGRDALHRGDRRSAGALGGGEAARRHRGVGIQPHPATDRRSPSDRRHIVCGMHPEQILVLHPRRLAQILVQRRVGQGRDHRRQPVGPFGMSFAGLVGQHVGMGEDRDRHGATIAVGGPCG